MLHKGTFSYYLASIGSVMEFNKHALNICYIHVLQASVGEGGGERVTEDMKN